MNAVQTEVGVIPRQPALIQEALIRARVNQDTLIMADSVQVSVFQ